MSQFFKMFFASCLGVLVALGVLFLIGIGIISAIASSAEKTEHLSPNSVLRLTFDQVMPEQTNNVESTSFSDLKKSKILGVHDVADAIRRAAEDDNIKGILLEPEMASLNGFFGVLGVLGLGGKSLFSNISRLFSSAAGAFLRLNCPSLMLNLSKTKPSRIKVIGLN